MGRQPRPHLPGTIFHVTARTLGRERLFVPDVCRGAIADLVDTVPSAGVRLLAVTVMSNHLHLVFQQGRKPLARLMQPLLQRIARRVHRACQREGPVFWRHYAAVACLDPGHARNAIVYTHLNPVRAGICQDAADHAWSSHALYAGGATASPDLLARLRSVLDPTIGLPLFATGPGRSVELLRADYRRVVASRLAMDRLGIDPGAVGDEPALPTASPTWWGGAGWGDALSPLFHPPVRPGGGESGPGAMPDPAPDMTTVARVTMAIESPDVPLELIRRPGRGRERSRLRHAVIRRLHAAGFRNYQIARFMGGSESAVSAAIRRQTPPGRPGASDPHP